MSYYYNFSSYYYYYIFIIIIISISSSSSISSSCCCCCCCCVLIIRFSRKYRHRHTLCKLKNFRLTSPYYPNPNSRKNRSQSIRINPILAHLQFPVAAAATPALSVPVIIASAITNDQRHADLARRERERSARWWSEERTESTRLNVDNLWNVEDLRRRRQMRRGTSDFERTRRHVVSARADGAAL